MRVGEKGLSLIKKFEGWYSKPYLDPIGIPTIGYGFTYYLPSRKKVTMQDKALTLQEGEVMLKEVLKGYEGDVLRLVKKPLTQNQFDALVSFTYNLGGYNLSKSTLLKKININPNDSAIAGEFVKWNRAGGAVLKGLTRRREAERDLYFKE
ncbi:lysozyme [Sphingobacterium sp. UT-1RO-CII-1]|uniref:lysozyme n=1 Tax=Sphingobacterium sp. UT-1RO-CII-1 TaxID=2995225 RepID=UPI00227BBB8A|nr:lysozyme [Sphingobacterium sp. UT-1RO-CII-1]MCY4781759.1 lysozyme [Sphingobacterium sp. UT-1RO-CII-1]